MSKLTHGERLARIEVILEEKLERNNPLPLYEALAERIDKMDERWDTRLSSLEDVVKTDVAEMTKLKSKGAGILVGVGLVFSGVSAWATGVGHKLVAFFH